MKSTVFFFHFQLLQQTVTAPKTMNTIVRTLPSSMISMAKPGSTVAQTGPGGKQTIVIAAPKGGQTIKG